MGDAVPKSRWAPRNAKKRKIGKTQGQDGSGGHCQKLSKEEQQAAFLKEALAKGVVLPQAERWDVEAPATPPSAANGPPAKWTRVESRSQPGEYYHFDQAGGRTMLEPPEPWEKKESRSRANVVYYWNRITGA